MGKNLYYELGVLMYNIVNTINIDEYDSFSNFKHIIYSLGNEPDLVSLFEGYNSEAANHGSEVNGTFEKFNKLLKNGFDIY